MKRVFVTLIALGVVLRPQPISAQNADALAKETQNPVSSLISVPFQGNWDMGIGERSDTGTLLNIQPVMPFSLNKEWNIIARVITPLVSQPRGDGTRLSGIGDTVATVFLSPARTGRIIWGAGPVMLLPTATNGALGTEKVGLGPSVVALAQPGPWTVGALFNHIWSLDGATDRPDVNQTLLQPFVNYNLGGGLSIGASTEAVANWEADTDKWTVPLFFTVGKVALLGKRPVNFQAAVAPYVMNRDGAADWRLRLAVTFLFPR